MRTTQQVKEYLSQIQKNDRLINRLQSTVDTLRSSLTSQSYELKPDKVQTSGPKNTLEETIAKIIDFEADITRNIDELVDLKRKVYNEISRLPEQDHKNILIARYIEGKRWEQIAVEIHYSVRQVTRLHGAALHAFFEVNSSVFQDCR